MPRASKATPAPSKKAAPKNKKKGAAVKVASDKHGKKKAADPKAAPAKEHVDPSATRRRPQAPAGAAGKRATAKASTTKKSGGASSLKRAPAAAPTARKATRTAAKAVAAVAGGDVSKAQGEGPGPVRSTVTSKLEPKVLEEQRVLLLEERQAYEEQAEALKAEADQLAAEMEPGDVQFDEESGEGDSIGMERERDLQLAGQARAAMEEIDRALAKIEAGTYGICERCNQPIPHARLKALPYAALCVACKSGGLTSRR